MTEYFIHVFYNNFVDKYRNKNYDYDMGYSKFCIQEIYIKRFNKGIVNNFIKVLSHNDGQGSPTYHLKNIRPNFFLTPYEIHYIYVIKYFKEKKENIIPEYFRPTFEIFKVDNCVICLDKKPEIMFYDCLHCCICSDCEKLKV